ncbi:MAG: hypothetical protein LBC99_06985 [Spirochaetota bacterium]|jgi:hypothetical protein|nr:hypothetical protein [Spirochaetota bacterium]
MRGISKWLVLISLITALAAFSMQAAESRHPIDGVWKSMRAIPGLVDGTLRFSIANKTLSFAWQGRGQLQYAIESVDFDTKTGMTRYLVSLSGAVGAMNLNILISGDSVIYIGHTPRGGIAIWGAYTRQN